MCHSRGFAAAPGRVPRRTGLYRWLMGCICCSGLTMMAESVTADQYGDPTRFQSAIEAFEKQDAEQPPPAGAVLFVGSSTIRMWHANVARDMAPLTVIARGFGGSNMNDALYYADRIIFPYRPRAVILYEGDNDVAQQIPPTKIVSTFDQLVKKIHGRLPQTRIYFLSIKPSVRRWSLQPQAADANARIKALCERDRRLTYVDLATPMLDDQGQVRPDLFLDDKLHMNGKGYALWTARLRPLLIKREMAYEESGKAAK